jgi:hypothetical protein
MIPEPCAGQPVSWLTLERHALGELGGPGAAVADHLDACAACRAAMAMIEADRRAMPPLPDLWRAAAARRRRQRGRWGGALAVAVAAAALLFFWQGRRERAPMVAGVKGDEISLSLVRERGGDVVHDPGGFRPGDRFKVLVTCAADAPVTVELTVEQAGAIDRPLPARLVRCGNSVPLPGAFVITGSEPVSICVAVGEATECRALAAE